MSSPFLKNLFSLRSIPVFLFKKLIKPRSHDEDTARMEFILNIILLASIFLVVVAFLQSTHSLVVQGELYKGDSPWYILSILILFVGLLVLSRKGFIKSAGYAVVILYFIPISYGLYYFGVDQPQALLSYAIVVVMAGILVGTRFSFMVTSMIALIILVLGFFQTKGIHVAHAYWRQEELGVVDIVIFSITFYILAVISWLSNREIERSLMRARAAERDLRKERDSLEVKVKERTRELERLHLEKTEQMHRFVEFGRMASGLFHDMVNPVQAAILSLDNVKREAFAGGGAGLAKSLNEATTQMERAKEFISIARNQITKQDVQMVFDPEEQVALVFQMLSFRAKRENVDLAYTPHSTPLKLRGNPLSFNRLLAGLVANAIDAYDGVPFDDHRTRVVTIVSKEHKNSLHFEVADNGKGISPEHQKKIFEVFFTTKGIEKGTGIGLALCREIVEKEFGGAIGFASKEGVGTTFTAELLIKNA